MFVLRCFIEADKKQSKNFIKEAEPVPGEVFFIKGQAIVRGSTPGGKMLLEININELHKENSIKKLKVVF